MSLENPFVGLRPFEADDSLLFFGRQQQIGELIGKLHDARFVAVVGSSGCGKSSLVRAGLIPKLQAGFLVEDRDVWHVHKMKPGDSPMENLAAAFLTNGGPDRRTQAQTFARGIQEGGVQAVLDFAGERFSDSDSNLLLLVDQFEELFRVDLDEQTDSERERSADFVSIMLELAGQAEIPVYVIMTMRSDFLGDCDRFHGLPEAMNRSQYLVPRLTREQRREAIEGPVRLFRAEITPRLSDRLLNESIDTRDDLPVLQHALMRTWDTWHMASPGDPIDVVHYDAIGTIHSALSKDAEAALVGMSDRQLLMTKRLFQSLTTIDAANRRIRRPAKLSEVAARSEVAPSEIWPIVQKFRTDGRSFLVTSSDDPGDNPLIDISHESLIRQWATLGTWVAEEAESIKIYKRLAETAVLYGKHQAGLYRDPDLQVALDWRTNESPNPTWAKRHHENFDDAMNFLVESKEVRDREWARTELARQWRLPRVVIASFVIVLYFFGRGVGPINNFWEWVQTIVRSVFELLAQLSVIFVSLIGAVGLEFERLDRFSLTEDQLNALLTGFTDMLRVGAHLLLFLGLAYVGKRSYGAYVFGSLSNRRAGHTNKMTRHASSKLQKIRRILEGIAKWTSLILGTLILGTCSVAGVSSGGASGITLALIGVAIALALVGWVFAAARLNADMKAIREDIKTLPPR